MPSRHAIHLHVIGSNLCSFSLLTGDGRPHTRHIAAVPKVVSYATALAVSPVNSSENSYLKITSQENAGIRRRAWPACLSCRQRQRSPTPLERSGEPAIYLVLQPTTAPCGPMPVWHAIPLHV